MNTTTLNMTTLDGGIIIKKGTAPAPPSGGGGDSTIEYLDVSGLSVVARGVLSLYGAMIVRGLLDDGKGNINLAVCSPVAFANVYAGGITEWAGPIQAIAVDLSQDFIVNGNRQSWSDVLAVINQIPNMNIDLSSIPRITKEQFYTLE